MKGKNSDSASGEDKLANVGALLANLQLSCLSGPSSDAKRKKAVFIQHQQPLCLDAPRGRLVRRSLARSLAHSPRFSGGSAVSGGGSGRRVVPVSLRSTVPTRRSTSGSGYHRLDNFWDGDGDTPTSAHACDSRRI